MIPQQKNGQPFSSLNSISFTQILLEPQIKLTHIEDDHYFILINKRYQKALCFSENKRYENAIGTVKQINEQDIEQIFQIQKILQDKYQLVHGISTLIVTEEDDKIKLTFGKWKTNQFFYPQKINNNSQKLQYWIKTDKHSGKYLYYDGNSLKCGTRNPSQDDTVWQIRLCLYNKKLNRACWFQNVFSNQVIDIPQASQKQDTLLIQYPCNYRLNQRFIIRPQQNNSFAIQSIKTGQFITVLQSPFSISIVQQPWKNKVNQQWNIQYLGCSLYKIKSCLKQNMYLVVKDKSIKQAEQLSISDNQSECLWKIIGNFNLMPNRDDRF